MSYAPLKQDLFGYRWVRRSLPSSSTFTLPQQFVLAMAMTTSGQRRLQFLQRIGNQAHYQNRLKWADEYFFGLTITNGPVSPGSTAHGETEQPAMVSVASPDVNETGYGIRTTISLRKTDRMTQFSNQEILNIVGIHESYHIEEDGKVQAYLVGKPGEAALYSNAHHSQITNEIKARLEFSLLYQDLITCAPLSSWQSSYEGYLQVVRDINARTTPAFKRYDRLQNNLERLPLFIANAREKRMVAQEDTSDFQNDVAAASAAVTSGRKQMNSYYSNVLLTLMRRYPSYKNGDEFLPGDVMEKYTEIYAKRFELFRKPYWEVIN